MTSSDLSNPSHPTFWWGVIARAAVLGAAGFVYGYVEPLVLYPDPGVLPALCGVFGAAGFGAALLAGFCLQRWVLWPWLREGAFLVVCGSFLLGMHALLLPGATLTATLIDGEVLACEGSAARFPAALTFWEGVAGSDPHPEYQPKNWRQTIRQQLDEDHGVVLTIRVVRSRDVLTSPSGERGSTTRLGPWRNQSYESGFFARYRGADCGDYAIGRRTAFEVPFKPAKHSPPETLPAFLQTLVVEPVPAELEELSSRTEQGANPR